MKRLGGLWPRLVAFENLYLAYRKARRGKQSKRAVAAFGCDLEKELLRLQDELQTGAYRPGAYRLFTIYEHKHPRKSHVVPVYHGLEVLGYRVFPHSRRLRAGNGYRFVRKLRRFARGYAAGRLDWEDFDAAVQSWIGHASHADTWALREAIFSATVFRRASAKRPPVGSGRLVEQPTRQGAVRQPQQERAG